MSGPVAEINKETFWELISQAKECCGQDLQAEACWLEEKLMSMGPEQCQQFHNVMHAYLDMAHKYGLWNAAALMCRIGSDDGFIDFRAWLIAQGRDVYLAAMKDPDTLADVVPYGQCRFESLCYVGDIAYEKLTGGRSAYEDIDREGYQRLMSCLRRDIQYGKGIEYPREWDELGTYLPKMCAKYLRPGELEFHVRCGHQIWNHSSPNIQQAIRNYQRKQKKIRGDAR